MLKTSKTKDLSILFLCLIAIYFSVPSFYPSISKGKWANFFSEHKINLGLDLRGGAYILLDADLAAYEKEQAQRISDQVAAQLKVKNYTYSDMQVVGNEIKFTIANENVTKELTTHLQNYFGGIVQVKSGDNIVKVVMDESSISSQKIDLMNQMISIIRRRLDETGTKEIDIQRQGDSYILVQVPGLRDPEQIKRLLGKTAKLSFNIVEDSVSVEDARAGQVPFGVKILPLEDDNNGKRNYMAVQSKAMLTGDMLENAQATVHEGRAVVNFRFNTLGAKIFGEATSHNTGRLMAIVLDNKIISAPVIKEPILGGSGQISGNFSIQSANELALLLRAGALPVPLKVAEERTVGPSLGSDSIEAGTKAAIIGTIFVVIFMFIFYGLFGVIANIALMFNLVMMVAILGLFGATLTMPGIAGIVLTLGMAVDSNVLIFERIREEALKGRTPLAAIDSGYSLAFATIFDSNLTTILAAIILMIFGTGPVKGFAITLSVGIICSMFTSITLSKVITAHWYRKFKPSVLPL